MSQRNRFHYLFILLVSLFFSFSANSQYTHNMTVYGPNRTPMKNLEVVMVETSTFKRTVYRTDNMGQLSIELTSEDGSEWMISIGGMKNHTLLKLRPGSYGSGSSQVNYDVARWNRKNEKPKDRSKLNLTIEPQNIPANVAPDGQHEIFEVQVVSENKRPFPGLEVGMTCYSMNKTFTARTDNKGIARFKLPLNKKFQIDLDGEENFEYHDVGATAYKQRITITYEKLNFKEVANAEGYLEQTFPVEPKPVSNRVMVKMNIAGGPNGGANEDIWVETDYSSKKYHGKSDANGDLVMMLPKKNTYKVHFKYQNDADVLDLSRFYGIGWVQKGFRYSPDPRLQFPENYLPKAETVKQYDINQFNLRQYDNTQDDELLNVHVRWGNNKINSGSMEALLELGFSVKEPIDKKAISRPLNIAFVLDKSGSMSGENIDLLKSAMLDFVNKLRPQDHISVIFFDTESVLAYDKPKLDKAYLQDIIGAVQAGGGTNIFDGLKLGYEQVDKNKSESSVNRVILLTDGYGSQPVDFVKEQSQTYFEKGISVSTIGVGEDYNNALLDMLTKYSGGFDHQAIQSEGITKAMDAEFESLLYPLASDLKVKVKYGNRIIYRTLYGVKESKQTDRTVHFELPKVYSSLNRMALMKFKVENPRMPEPMTDIDKDKIQIIVTYFDERKGEEVEIIKETNLEWTDETDVEMVYDEQMKQTYSVAVINQTLKSIADLCDAKRFEEAKKTIQATKKSLKKTTADQYSEELLPLIEQLNEYIVALDRAIKKFK